MQILTRGNQFDHKEGISTIDTIIKVEQYIANSNHGAEILLMGLTKECDAINRTPLWTTLYKIGIPIDMIKHIRQGHRDTKLAPKYKGHYGAPSSNNIGVFRESAISALLFIIRMEDMMGDNAALNRGSNPPPPEE